MTIEWPQVPYVGVGCIVIHAGRVLLVRNQGGLWSTPGGHLDFGESPAAAAIRETAQETGVSVDDVAFVAVTNDVMMETGRHYVTIWMRGETSDPMIAIRDREEIEEADWFDPAALPTPRHAFFENLLARRTLPPKPDNLELPMPPADRSAARGRGTEHGVQSGDTQEASMHVDSYTPVIPSADLEKSLRFWVEGLGLTMDRAMRQDGRLIGCMVHNERLYFWLNQRAGKPTKPEDYEGIRLYWAPRDFQGLRTRLQRLGYAVSEITDRDYGQTEFFVTDDDGYSHCFGVATTQGRL